MSPLTKGLIVLLTFSSVFLCATVVSYVSNAEDYRNTSESLKADADAAERLQKQANKDYEQAKQQFDQNVAKLNSQISDLRKQVNEAKSNLNSARRKEDELLKRVDKWEAINQQHVKTNDEQGKLLETTQSQLDKARDDMVKLKKELDETSRSMLEKMAVLETLESKVKQLKEENTELLARLGGPLKPLGKELAPARSVIPAPSAPARAAAAVVDINLKGLVTAVDMKNSMASISLGSVDGVSDGMRFHVVSGDSFICDIVVISVDTEQSVGILDLIEQAPRPPMVGDSAVTNF